MEGKGEFVQHPLIREGMIKRRGYQDTIARKSLQKPTLVVLPTGLGKTVVALLLMAERLKRDSSQILMMAPTKPLVEQHGRFFQEALEDVSIVTLTGEIPPQKRAEMYAQGKVVIATPQIIRNDVMSGDLSISTFHTMIVDEAHRATGDYPYTFITERFYQATPSGLVLGLTASPGHDMERIYEVCRNLGIENIEVRVDSDPDVKPYIQDLELEWVKVEVSRGMREIISILERMFLERVGKLQRMGVLQRGRSLSVKALIGAAGRIQEAIRKAPAQAGAYYQAMSIQAQAMKVSHALELAETQGPVALYAYMDRMIKETGEPKCSRATKQVVSDAQFRLVLNRVEALRGEDHPKVQAVERFVKQSLREAPHSRIIVFTHFRDTATMVLEALKSMEGIGVRPVRFVGQASRGEDHGLSQKKQKEILDSFRSGDRNVLIATSVAEEGLDIPGADLVIFFEPIPSEIRTIQRRGRTGRHSSGKVIVLMSRDTRDVTYSWSAKDKEKRMERQLLTLRRMLAKRPLQGTLRVREAEKPKTLDSFVEKEDGPEIIVDTREMPSGVVEELMRGGARIRSSTLEVGDYIISDRLVVERKTAQDLSDSLVDGRLFQQAVNISSRFDRCVIVIEGDNIFTKRDISREALMGALSSLIVDFNIPLMFTQDPKGTADFLLSLARREMKGGKRPKSPKVSLGKDLRSIQLEIMSSIPGISGVIAERMMDHFGTVERAFTASVEELMKVEGVGRVKAREIRGVISSESPPSK